MEHVHARDNNSSPRPTDNSPTPPIHEGPSLLISNGRQFDAEHPPPPSPSPSTTSSQNAEKSRISILQSFLRKFVDLRLKPPLSESLFRGFERPSLSRIAILTALCLTSYPAFYLLTIVAKDRSLFVVRAVVSVWCSVVGFALGYIILAIGARHLESASEFVPVGCRDFLSVIRIAWATVIHMSHEGGGMKLRDLARGSGNPTSFMPAFHILRSRFRNRETARRSRKSYEFVPILCSALCLLTLLQQATMVPVLRILHRPRHPGPPVTFFIRTDRSDQYFHRCTCRRSASWYFLIFEQNQYKAYREVLIAGDLSKEDEGRAALGVFAVSQLTLNAF